MVGNVGAPHGHVCALPAQETYSGGGRRRDGRWFIYLAETLLPPACPFIFRPTCMTIPDVRAFLIPPPPPLPYKKGTRAVQLPPLST